VYSGSKNNWEITTEDRRGELPRKIASSKARIRTFGVQLLFLITLLITPLGIN